MSLATSPPAWTLAPGDTVVRKQLHEIYGGRTQGGMTTTPTGNMFLFTDRKVGAGHGYHDGWESEYFHYVGMGQRGDQVMKDMNRVLLNHQQRGLTVRLFRGSGPVVTYLGQFDLAGDPPTYTMDAGETGNPDALRQVIAFKLAPVGEVIRESRDDRDLPAGISGQSAEAALEGGPPVVVVVDVEAQHTTSTTVVPSANPYQSHRAEQALVHRYKAHLEAQGHEVKRLSVLPTGEANVIRSDVFDVTAHALIEAKGSGTRFAVRMALAQVLDYGRFKPDALRAVLLPSKPRDDLEQLMLAYDVYCVWETAAGFADNCDGRLI
jgi:hypothetical protein